MPFTRLSSKTFLQQGHIQFSARSVLAIREHGKLARTPLPASFNNAMFYLLKMSKFPQSLDFF